MSERRGAWESLERRKSAECLHFSSPSRGKIFTVAQGVVLSSAMAKMLPSTSTIGTFFAVCVISLPSLVVSKRCDKQIDSFVRSNCMECSVNAFFQRPCPSGYQQVTSGEGEQSCAYSVFFGFNFGSMRVPGCQHNCSRKITQKECCAGFWGQDCQGI